MAGQRDNRQDQLFSQMERLLKNQPREKKVTTEEEFRKHAEWVKLSPQEKIQQMTWHEWERELRDKLHSQRQIVVPERSYNKILDKYRKKLEEFHRNGTSFKQVLIWMEETSDEFIGWN